MQEILTQDSIRTLHAIAEPIVIYPNSIGLNILYALIGFLGIFLKIGIQLVKNKKRKFKDLWEFIVEDSLVVGISVGSYLTIILIWMFEGLDFFGLYKATLNVSTLFIGLGSERMLATFMKEKYDSDVSIDTNEIIKENIEEKNKEAETTKTNEN